MKQNKLFYGMALLATLGLAGCSNDLPGVDPDNQPSDVDRKVYLNLAISGDMVGTRAGADGNPADDDTDFNPGEGAESDVKDVYFVFYDTNGNQVGNLVQMKISQFTTGTNPDPSNTVEKRWYSVVEVDVLKGQTAPAQVMCYVNPLSPQDLQNPLSTIQTVTREKVMTGEIEGDQDNRSFPMSNSVYYDTDQDGNPCIVAAPVKKTYGTYAEASAALEDQTSEDITDIYLERYATKLKFNVAQGATAYTAKAGTYNADGSFNDNGPAVVLNFNVDGWDLNAEATSIYAVKSFRNSDPTTGVILENNETYEQLNAAFAGNPAVTTWGWNNATFHRSYWAKSPAYFQATYPEVASDLQTMNTNQKYLSYTDIVTNGKKAADYNKNFYFRETTVGQPALDSENPAAAMPSIVLAGHYTMTLGGTSLGTNGVSFYTYQDYPETTGTAPNQVTVKKPYIYFEHNANSYTSAVTGGTSMFERFLRQQTTLYRKVTVDNKDTYVLMTPDELLSICSVTHPVVNTGEKLADRRVTLQLNDNVNTATNGVYVAYGNGYSEIGATASDDNKTITLQMANTALRTQVGYAIYYTGGKGFFNIPIHHYGWQRASNTNKDADKINWKNVRVGDFGLVRNHIYEIEVESITGLATGIAGEGTEIVPPRDYDEYYIGLRINIQKWAVVPKQSVKL